MLFRSAAAPGRPAREDYEYERNGVAAIFCAVAPHLGWRCIEERERKTRVDYAHFLRALREVHFRGAEKIVLVQDNLNTHSPASLYEAFAPEAASRDASRIAPRSRANSTRGSVTATSPRAPSAGSPPPPPHAPNSASFTHHVTTDTALV